MSEEEIKLIPVNRYLVVEVEKQEQNDAASNLYLPESYKKSECRYKIAKLISKSDDCKLGTIKGGRLIIDSQMLEEIRISEDIVFQVILENYVIGFLD